MTLSHEGYIGVFDSGVGGISILRELARALPHEDFLYFGDSANAPYGEKSRDQVLRRSRSIVDMLLDEGCKAIVIACNTATSVAAAELRGEYAHVPIVGVEPALKPATLTPGVERILVMATPITLRLDKYQQLAERWGGGHEIVEVPCPGLAARIEQGNLEADDLRALLDTLVGSYFGLVDGVVLGCTHYPFVSHRIRQAVGDVPLFDGACGTARQLERRLADRGLLSKSKAPGEVEFSSSRDTSEELELYRSFFDLPL